MSRRQCGRCINRFYGSKWACIVMLLVSLAMMQGCAFSGAHLNTNSVTFGSNGEMIDPTRLGRAYNIFGPYWNLRGTDNQAEFLAKQVGGHIPDNVLEGLRAFLARPDPISYDDRECKAPTGQVTIFIHGGLVSMKTALDRVPDLANSMLCDGVFPIMINWEGGVWPNLRDHLFFTRAARSRALIGPLTSPLVLVADLGRGISYAPMVWFDQAWVFFSGLTGATPRDEKASNAVLRFLDRKAMTTEWGGFEAYPRKKDHFWARRSPTEGLLMFRQLISGGLTFGISPLVDSFGSEAWREMKRKVSMTAAPSVNLECLVDGGSLFSNCTEPMPETDPASQPLAFERPVGVDLLMKLLAEVEREIEAEIAGGKKSWPIKSVQFDLIGHSMGAFVVNEVLAHATRGGAVPDLDRIVYLAAADSLESYQAKSFAYLRSRLDKKVELYHAVLNPRDELSESHSIAGVLEFVPRGSLLVWLDRYLEKESRFRSRTAGRFVNLVPVILETPADLRSQIFFKSYPESIPGRNCPSGIGSKFPKTHGSFTDFRFWRKSFFTPRPIEDQRGCFVEEP